MVRRNSASPTEALATINKGRRKRKEREVTKSTVHRYVNGQTHRLGAKELRGRHRVLSKRDVRSLETARRRLIKKADNDYRVTYKDIVRLVVVS